MSEPVTSGTDRVGWAALPRRRPVRPARSLTAIRSPLSRRARWVLVTLSVLLPIAAWLALSTSGAVSPTFLPTPQAVWAAGVKLASSGQLATDAWASIVRVLLGFGLAVAVSVPLGIVMGSFRAAQAFLEPVVGLLRYLPASAFIPLLIIWLGAGRTVQDCPAVPRHRLLQHLDDR
jgi:NitT/TauT family transport system permease protein